MKSIHLFLVFRSLLLMNWLEMLIQLPEYNSKRVQCVGLSMGKRKHKVVLYSKPFVYWILDC